MSKEIKSVLMTAGVFLLVAFSAIPTHVLIQFDHQPEFIGRVGIGESILVADLPGLV